MSDGRPAASLLDQRLEIETPERVVIVHDLAGIGSRFAAGLVDAAILTIPWCAASCVLALVMPLSSDLKAAEVQAVGLALVGVCTAMLWVYFLAFETFWGGRTPGKRAFRLRVMSVHGGPAAPSAVILRNVLRVVDSLPTGLLPFVGGVSMFLTRRAQRVGDLAAGTVVVRERPETLRVPLDAPGAAPADAESVSPADLEEVDRFLDRRRDLLPAVREAVAERLAARMRARHGLPPGDPETILGLLGARRTPAQIRDLAGPALGLPPELARGPRTPPPPEAAP